MRITVLHLAGVLCLASLDAKIYVYCSCTLVKHATVFSFVCIYLLVRLLALPEWSDEHPFHFIPYPLYNCFSINLSANPLYSGVVIFTWPVAC
jgi:hypothetical protein